MIRSGQFGGNLGYAPRPATPGSTATVAMLTRHLLGTLAVVAVTAIALGVALWALLPRDQEMRLAIGAGPSGSETYAFARALAQLTSQQDIGFTLDVVETSGSGASGRAVSTGNVQLGLVRSDVAMEPGVAAIAAVFPEVLHLVAREAAGIATPADLAGKNVALMPWGSGSASLFAEITEHYNFAAGEVEISRMTPVLATAALINGQLDAVVDVIALGNATMVDLLSRERVNLVAIDQAEAIQMFAPTLERMVIPRGALSGRPPVPADDLEALAVRTLLVAGDETASTVVRKLTALLFEQRTALAVLHEQSALLEGEPRLEALGVPVHPGARAHYNADKPLFVVEYAEPMAFAMSAAVLVLSGLWQASRWFEAKRKNRGDRYNGELAKLVERLRGAGSAAELDEIEERIYAIFQQVVSDIDHDRLATESLPTFDFVWRSATELLDRRRGELGGSSAVTRPAPRVLFKRATDRGERDGQGQSGAAGRR